MCSFPLRRIAVTGSCFCLFYFVFVSRRFPDIRIVYRLVICALIFFLANRFHCPYNNVLLKAFIVFFSPGARFTTMASFFLSTKILKKSKTRLSLLGFLAFISTNKPLSSTKPAMRLFLKKQLSLQRFPIVFKQQPLSLLSFLKHGAAVFKNGRQLLHGLGTQHGYARLSEVGDALEDGRGGEMAACVQDATILVDALHVYA